MESAPQLTIESELRIDEILSDYKLAVESRENSYIGRKEVFMGKAKFGIFGDGKEIPQIAMAKVFRNGDFRSGYYRDQTMMMAMGEMTSQQFFAQLYAHTDVNEEPASGGRLMNGHFATRSLDEKGNWKDLMKIKNSASDISCTAGQIPRLLGLAYASKLYRNNKDLHAYTTFSNKGNEVAFGTIGNASTSEGSFLEMINAAGVLQVPMVLAVWDDEYGISVPNKYHTTKSSISKALSGFQRDDDDEGIEIIEVKGWDYLGLCRAFKRADRLARKEHIPVLVHVIEVTQPQGHSTSGSHERYKSKSRLDWEREFDCNKKMREWILENGFSTDQELDIIEDEAKLLAKEAKNNAWKSYLTSVKGEVTEVLKIINRLAINSKYKSQLGHISKILHETVIPDKSDAERAAKKSLRWISKENIADKQLLLSWLKNRKQVRKEEYSSHVYSQSEMSALKIDAILPVYSDEFKLLDGREVLNAAFDKILERDPLVFAIGEDVGKIGDVNQGMAGLQDKYGELRVTDTGIRETSIMGQGIGAALRGLRPIAEIQYLDYIYYCVQVLTDDLACLHYRTKGGQKAPLIIRTRGHRLEGVWHSGSPMSMILGALRGIYLLVPRNMTQAAGFYNTMLASDDVAIIVESLNGYRLKEKLPENIGEIRVPLGQVEVLKEGKDVTIITYGSMCRIVMEAAKQLSDFGIEVEVIDVQTLAPFDLKHDILKSLKKTNRIVFADEDVPGGASAYMLQKVIEEQGGYKYLDSKPVTVSAKEHRPAYGSDGDYYSKPNVEEVFDRIYEMMSEAFPSKFTDLY
ncbi:MAG: 2-oxoisovalerate dehydrogenase E1 component [Cyclobacteriaceae bacterium]|jgi:pyruvate/2-oxoglutarate/acetoin dehydrogenase E1 component/TPP-dependent pyruvate/acetoin dehydrogenase alpha subunit